MQWLDKAGLRLRSLFRRSRLDHELDDELQFYLDVETAKHLASGLSPTESKRAARRSLGNATRVKEECRDARGLNAFDDVGKTFGMPGGPCSGAPGSLSPRP